MPDWSSGAFVRQVAECAGYTVRLGRQWTSATPDGVRLPAHGWKLHVSSRAGTFEALARRLVPVLVTERCTFKLAAGSTVLATMNRGHEAPAAVGKAFTVYPEQARVRELGLALAELLRDHEGPRILSDRRVDERAPVYYRYGPFVAEWFRGERGVLAVQIPGPHGERFDAIADLEYRQPAWVQDPFGAEPQTDDVLGGRYRVDRGLHRAAQGSVFRALDTVTGERVIVKQARAHVGDPGDGSDARTRLRNERRVLAALTGVPGVPTFVDHFAHGVDEYLVTGDVGAENLSRRVLTGRSLLPAGAPAPEAFAELAAELAGTVAALHERGVVMRDITPRNVVLGADRAYLVDFGISALDGLWPPGSTYGFASARQVRNEPPRRTDDHHALGMTLAFAATGLLPLVGETVPGLAAERMLQSLDAVYRGAHAAFTALVTDLLSGDEELGAAALLALTDPGVLSQPAPRASAAPRAARATAAPRAGRDASVPAGAIAEHLLRTLLDQLDPYLFEQPGSAHAAIDGSVYTGSAGVGLELLHHRDRPGVGDALDRLAAHTVAADRRAAPPPGLFLGSTGSLVFLGRMRAAGYPVEVAPPPVPPYQTIDEHDDVITGTAGVGLGHLDLAGVLDDPAHLAAARACVDHLLGKRGMTMAVRGSTGLPDEVSTDPQTSYSHGRAGVVELLVGYTMKTGDPMVRVEARARLHKLATRAVELTRRAREPGAVPISASWCQGLAGISRTLLHGAELLGEPELAEPALGAAEACTAWVPRMQNVGQCCGLAGVGAFLLDLYRYTGEARHLTAAHGVGRQLLRRSFGPDDAPLFVDAKRTDAPLSWAMGTAGVLAFFRRLHHSEAPDPVPSAADVLRARSRTTRSESAGSYDVAPEHARSFSS